LILQVRRLPRSDSSIDLVRPATACSWTPGMLLPTLNGLKATS